MAQAILIGLLTDKMVKAATSNGKPVHHHDDGGGLKLQVTRDKSKSWLYRGTLDGKPLSMGLGSASAVSLEQAPANRS